MFDIFPFRRSGAVPPRTYREYGNHAYATSRNKRSETEERSHNFSLSLSGSALAIKRTSSGSSFPELGGYGHTWSTLTSTVSRLFALLFNAIRLTAGPNSLFRYSLNCRHFAFVFISSELPQMMNPSAPRSVIFRKVASRSACGGKQIHFPEILIARLEPRVSLSKEDKKKKRKRKFVHPAQIRVPSILIFVPVIG